MTSTNRVRLGVLTTRLGWAPGAVTAEGWNHARTGRWTSAGLVAVVMAGCASIGAWDAVTSDHVARLERRWIAEGGTTLQAVVGDYEYRLSSDRCAAVASGRNSAVLGAAGLARRADPVAITSRPGSQVTFVVAGQDVWRVAGRSGSTSRGALVPASLAAQLLVSDGDYVRVSSAAGTRGDDLPARALRIDVIDDDALPSAFLGIVVASADSFEAQACVVRTTPAALSSVALALPGLASDDSGVRVTSLAGAHGALALDLHQEWRHRPTRWLWVAVSLLASAFWSVILWSRREQTALLTSLGLARPGLLLLRATEWLTLVSVGAVWGACSGAAIAIGSGVGVWRALDVTCRTTLAVCLLASVLVSPALTGRRRALLHDLKDR